MRSRAPLLAVVACLVLAAGFYFGLWKPQHEQQLALEQETAQLVTQQQQLRNEIAQLEEVEANQVEIRAALARLEEFIPSGPAQPTAIRSFQEAADAAGVEIVSVTFAAPTAVDGAPETGDPGTQLAAIPLTMIVEGGYFQAVDFFRRLEVDVTRAALVETIAFTEGDDEFPQLSATMSGQLFAVVPAGAALEAPLPAPDAAPAEGTEEGDADDDEATDDEEAELS